MLLFKLAKTQINIPFPFILLRGEQWRETWGGGCLAARLDPVQNQAPRPGLGSHGQDKGVEGIQHPDLSASPGTATTWLEPAQTRPWGCWDRWLCSLWGASHEGGDYLGSWGRFGDLRLRDTTSPPFLGGSQTRGQMVDLLHFTGRGR